jgi:hypothetical protein
VVAAATMAAVAVTAKYGCLVCSDASRKIYFMKIVAVKLCFDDLPIEFYVELLGGFPVQLCEILVLVRIQYYQTS